MLFLINLLGAAALLLWGLRMVRTGVLRAYGSSLRTGLGRAMGNRFSAFFGGLGVTCLLQSSSATALIASSFASRKIVGTTQALAIMLGADLGTSLVAQAYAFPVTWVSPLLILVGWAMFSHLAHTQSRDLGRAIVGLGVTLLGLRWIGEAAEPLREFPALPQILDLMASTPIFGVITGAFLTIMSTSSLAVVLLVVSFTFAGVVPLTLGFALVLGANLGSAVMPIMATLTDMPEARRVPLGNLLFRLAGVAVVLPALPLVMPEIAKLPGENWRQILNFHTLFNLGLACAFIWFVGPVARLTEKLLPDRERPEDLGRPRYLSDEALESPALALANASREALRLGDLVTRMLECSLKVFRSDDRKLIEEVEALDSQVDRLNEAIKMYLTRVSREIMDPTEQRRIIDLITFTTNLEHVGDIVDKSLMELAAKKIKHGLKFSPEGSREIADIHHRLNGNVALAMNVFMTGDLALARQLFAEKQAFRELEREAAEGHIARLREGRIESIGTSGLHLDILRDLKRVNSHLALVGQPILESAGELRGSRLKGDA